MKKEQNIVEIRKSAAKKADDLSLQLGKKVYPMVINTEEYGGTNGEWVVGYIKAPGLHQKGKIIDAFNTNTKTQVGIDILRSNIIKEHSDIKFTQIEGFPENENIILGAALFITGKGYMFSIVEQPDELKKSGE